MFLSLFKITWLVAKYGGVVDSHATSNPAISDVKWGKNELKPKISLSQDFLNRWLLDYWCGQFAVSTLPQLLKSRSFADILMPKLCFFIT